ncbi:hypothetical protein F5B19DRAFT_218935 [Rostrohypoxylon terebratum]|nr:hypothetical protein F5B19DRAFT_218935 [Rostrohypoxylon terebratum]
MTSWEASQSPPRHSTHHRRRHHKPRDENQSYQISNISSIPNDRPFLKHPRKQHRSDLAIVNSHRPSKPHTRYDIVENWLAQTARRSPHPSPRNSQGRRREDAHSHHPSRPLNTIAPYNKHPRHVDQRWSPRHGFPADNLPQAASPFRDPGMRDPRKSRRVRITTSDSSFISGFGNSTRPPDHGPGPILQVRENTPPVRSPREEGLAPLDTSSTTSHVDDHTNFEKRPRHKTREDKYETKKRKRGHEDGTRGHEEDRRKKRKKAQGKKSAMSSKNVVNKFTSDAVLNDRITVQPHLKPGIFDNGRTSKRQPVSDLAFSEMQFLKHQKRNHQPKPLSKSRLREKRREDREMEEVSSFFLPHGADRKNQTPRPRGTIPNNNRRDAEYQTKQFTSTRFQGIPPPELPPYSDPTYVSPHDETVETLALSPHGCVDDGKDSGKSTTYFIWSTSHYSPRIRRRENSSSPDVSGSVWTTTPEKIRRDLIATGIYRDTGIPSYDDRLAEQSTKATGMDSRTPHVKFQDTEDKSRSPDYDVNGSKKVKYRDQAIMTEDPMNCSEPALSPQETREYQASGSQKEPSPQVSRPVQEIDRQKIARDARLNPPSRNSLRSNTQASNPRCAPTIATCQGSGSAKIESNQNLEKQSQEMCDPTLVASENMMPPPPLIPPSRTNQAMSLDASVKKAGPTIPWNTVPITERDVLESRHIANHNNASQDFQGLLERSNQSTSLSEPTVNDRRLLPSLDTASWIPQRTLSTRITETHPIISRPNMQSPFYVDQYERTLSGNSNPRDLTRSQRSESMAEFIARIEKESQQQSFLYENDTTCSELDLEKARQDPFIFDRELPDQQSPICDERQNTHPYPDPYPHLPHIDSERLSEHYPGGGEYFIEAQRPLHHSDAPRTLSNVVQPLGSFEEEQFEMSNFWRPNQLYQV